jgi:endonuclease V-like protein UPF0215 family
MSKEAPKEPVALAIPPAWTVNDVLHHVPEAWRDAIICTTDGLDRTYRIKRVILSIDHSGRKVVILSPIETKVSQWG